MANRTVSVNLVANIGQYVSGMNTAAAATMRLGDTAMASTKKTQSGFDLASKGALLAGAAVVGGLGLAVAKSMEFEKAMSGAAAATQATGAELDSLRTAAMKAGADTQYSATEAAQAITEMGKAGVSTADILDGGLNGALALAAAGQLDVAEAAEIASVAMTQFKLSGDQLPHVADLLAAGAGKAMGSVEDLGMALNQAGLVASAAGIGIEETTGTLAAFASAGLIGSDAGTSFRSMLQHLQNATGPAQEKMDELGISMYDAQGNFVGMEDLAGQLQTKMQDLTPAVRDAAMAQIFGSDAVRAANVLYSEGAEGIADWTAKVNDQGYAAEQAAKLNDNLAGDLERLGGSFDTLMISLGEGAQGPLRDLVQGLTDLIDAIGGDKEAFESLPGVVQIALDAFGGLADLLGGVIGLFADLPGPMQLAVVAAVGWAVAGDRIMGILKPMGGALGPLRGTWSAFGEALGYARQNGDGLSTVLKSVGDYAGSTALNGIKTLARAIGPELGIGLAVFGIGELVKGFQSMAGASEDAERAQSGFAEALRATNGVIDETSRAAAQRALVDADIVDTLKAAGVASKDAIDGLLGNAAAQERVTAALQDYITANPGGHHNKNAEAAREARNAYVELGTTLGMTKEEAEFFADAATGAATATEGSGTAATGAAGSMDAYATELEGAKTAADEARSATDMFKLSLDILTGAHIDMATAEAAFYDAVSQADGALKDLSGSTLTASGSLDVQSESGRKAQGVLFGIRDKASLLIGTMIEQGATADVVIAKDAELRGSFIRSATQMGISEAAANGLADQILGIPAERATKITADVGQAANAIASVQTQINMLKDKTVRITTVTTSADGTRSVRTNTAEMASGGILHAYASGGIEPMSNQIAKVVPSGTLRLIGDNMRVPESFIPQDGSDRSWAIWRQTGEAMAKLGMGREMSAQPAAMPTFRGREFSGAGTSAPSVNVAAPSLTGLTIQGRVTIDGNGIATIAGRVVEQAIGDLADGMSARGVHV